MRRFQSVDGFGFRELVTRFNWRRRITEIHLHHTWRPQQQDYRGLATIEAMWQHHTGTNGWSDIAQHVSIAPDGTIWIGRNFNWSPASATGFNGNATAGPFMIEMIGDFDIGRETPTDVQRDATLAVIHAVQGHFGLPPTALRFHNEMSTKSCPGTTQDKLAWIGAIEQFQVPSVDQTRAAFASETYHGGDALASMDPMAKQPDDMTGAEHGVEVSAVDAGRGLFGPSVDPGVVEALADHVINLTYGRFSQGGLFDSDKTDVDRIVEERLAAAIDEAKGDGRKARLLVYAHGGLVSESVALLGAYQQLDFWRRNHVYPLFFVWETGLAETLKAMILGARGLVEAPRGPVREWLDERVEDVVRALGADRVWSAMKRNAELANDAGGGAAYAGGKLSKLLKDRAADLELHLVGHSAGSIFITRFLKNLDRNVSASTAHFLAPAVTNELFLEQFVPRLGKVVDHLTVFTMKKTLELADTVTPLYRKSLLYMIYGALEPERDTDVLGLEISLRGDPRTAALFGLGGAVASAAEVVWSRSDGHGSGSASESATHGDFDNDKATLESVCRRVLGKVNGEPIEPYVPPARSRGRDIWGGDFEWPAHLAPWMGPGGGSSGVVTAPVVEPTPPPATSPSGRKLALCIGIDNYRHISPLAGCLNDRDAWRNVLTNLGFDVQVLPEEEATGEVILARLRRFIEDARPGDQLVLQYAGHGTAFTDLSADEIDLMDSALCAIDCSNPEGEGGLVVDDDIYEAFKLLPEGARLTAFFDCCHSGTMTRALGAPPMATAIPSDTRPRFVKPTPEMEAAYRRMRGSRTRSGARAMTGEAGLIGVQFSACLDDQLAYEKNGSGEFTVVATRLLTQSRGITNRGYHDAVIKAFGPSARQTPKLYCDPSAFDAPLALF